MVGPFGEVLVMDWGPRQNSSQGSFEPRRRTRSRSHIFRKASAACLLCRCHRNFCCNRTRHGHGYAGLHVPGASARRRGTLGTHAAISILLVRCCDSCSPASPKRLPIQVALASKNRWPPSAQSRPPRLPRIATTNVQEMALDVSRYLDGMAVGAHRESILEKAGRFYRRYSVAILLIAAYLFMRIVLLVVSRR